MIRFIPLNPVEMTRDTMQMLHDKGLIHRLCPGFYPLNPEKGQTMSRPLYQCDDRYGPHMLITVAVNNTKLSEFGTHPDTEDFLLIGDEGANPLYLVIALCSKEMLEEKIRKQKLSGNDFIVLRAKYNDPEVSFFSMIKNIPHGEMICEADRTPATFYVTESRDLATEIIDFRGYELVLDTGSPSGCSDHMM